MADIINLRRARKAKGKTERAGVADANRIKFGRTKIEREATKAVNTINANRHDAHKIEDDAQER